MAGSACEGCGRTMSVGRGFAFKTYAGEVIKCVWCALRHLPMLRRSLVVSLVVGTVLTAINQGDDVFAGRWTSTLIWQIPLTYLVPFLVSTYGALINVRR